METLTISPNTANLSIDGAVTYLPENRLGTSLRSQDFRVSPKPARIGGYASFIKPGADYVVNALGKALKQNLFGADINTEFLELSVRVYSMLFVKTAKQYLKQLSNKTLTDGKVLTGMFKNEPDYYYLKNIAS